MLKKLIFVIIVIVIVLIIGTGLGSASEPGMFIKIGLAIIALILLSIFIDKIFSNKS